ncbi:hypothetical protein OGATHE_000488 [Ogataea polymorpha]|uniref:Uncharacterized protein n=1 Tax=Ogataea polymorpha TaxID=460523 RepID=A0A9P8PV51_9ASCO|nr:hypothetical protein OGATHE_000488 [Ogataea polymorpha]
MAASAATVSSAEEAFFWASARSDLMFSEEKASNGWASTVEILSFEPGRMLANPPDTKYLEAVPDDSITSTTPGANSSTVGTWLAKTPISPELAGRLTWLTSLFVKMAWHVRN